MRNVLSAVTLSVTFAISAGAQETLGRSPEMIPRDLVEALFSAQQPTGRPPTFLVGSLPPTLEAKVAFPKGAKVLGGLSDGTMGYSVGVLLLDGPLNSVVDKVHTDLVAAGWSTDDPTVQQRLMRGDFVDAPSPQRRPLSGAPEMYCGRGGTLRLRFDPQGMAQTRLTVISSAVNQCAQMREAMMRSASIGGMSREPKRPVLVNPVGARNQDGICPEYNYGMGDRSQGLTTQLSSQELLAHYGKQLADSGWKSGGESVSAFWTRTDSTGMVYEYKITVQSYAGLPACRKVNGDLNGRTPRTP